MPLGTENRDERFRINAPRFAPRLDRGESSERAGVGVLSEAVLVIRVNPVTFPAKHAAKGEANAAGGQIKQVRGVNVQVQCSEFRRKNIPGVQPRELKP